MIVLGGELIQIGSLLMEPLMQVVVARAMMLPYKAGQIVQSHRGEDAELVRSAALIYTFTGKI